MYNLYKTSADIRISCFLVSTPININYRSPNGPIIIVYCNYFKYFIYQYFQVPCSTELVSPTSKNSALKNPLRPQMGLAVASEVVVGWINVKMPGYTFRTEHNKSRCTCRMKP